MDWPQSRLHPAFSLMTAGTEVSFCLCSTLTHIVLIGMHIRLRTKITVTTTSYQQPSWVNVTNMYIVYALKGTESLFKHWIIFTWFKKLCRLNQSQDMNLKKQCALSTSSHHIYIVDIWEWLYILNLKMFGMKTQSPENHRPCTFICIWAITI